MDDTERAGRRIAATRKSLGLTQQQLADRAKVSKSMLAKVESGHASASNVWVGSIARALGVDVGYLSGQPYVNGPPQQAEVHQLIPAVRRALASWDLIDAPDDGKLSTLEELRLDVRRLHAWRHDTNYQKIGAALPDVLTRLTIVTQQHDGDHDREQAYGLLTFAYRAANTMAHKLGYTDLSLTALDRMEWAASHSGDPLLVAIVDYVRAGALSRIGERDGALRLLYRAIASIEADAAGNDTALAVLGCLHMKCVAIYGSMSNGDLVDEHLAEATRIAATTGPDRIVYETVFGPTNVALHALSAKVDLGEPEDAMEVAGSVRIPDGMAKERTTYFYTDLARAHLLNNDPDKAIEALYQARSVAPVHFANSSVVRGTIYSIAAQQQRANRGLRALAHSVGIRD